MASSSISSTNTSSKTSGTSSETSHTQETMTSQSKSRLSSARSKQSASTASINMGGVVSLPRIELPDTRTIGSPKTLSTQSQKSGLSLNTRSEPGLSYSKAHDGVGDSDQEGENPAAGVAGLTADELGDLEESFAVFDRSGDGTINSSKLYRVMTSLIGDNPTEAEVQDLIIANDEDGGGTIEFDEYLHVMKDKIKVAPTDKELKIVYRMLDRNGSGGINLDDLTGVMRAMGADIDDEEIETMFDAVDLNGQKVISYEEFLDVVLSEDSEELDRKLEESGVDKNYIRVVPKLRNYIDDLELD